MSGIALTLVELLYGFGGLKVNQIYELDGFNGFMVIFCMKKAHLGGFL